MHSDYIETEILKHEVFNLFDDKIFGLFTRKPKMVELALGFVKLVGKFGLCPKTPH